MLIGLASLSIANEAVYAQPIIEDDIDTEWQQQQVHIVVDPPQVMMLGTSPNAKPTYANYPLFGLIGFENLGLSVVNTALGAAYVLRKKSALGAASDQDPHSKLHFEFGDAIANVMDQIDSSSDWRVRQLSYSQHKGSDGKSSNRKRPAQRILRADHIDSVMFFKFTYFFSPEFDRIRVRVETSQYIRLGTNHVSEKGNRIYEYLSPSYGVVLRSWRDGEREQRLADIAAAYERRVTEFPNNIRAYEEDRKLAEAALKDHEKIPPLMAISEFWTADRFQAAMNDATEHIKEMLHRNLKLYKDPYDDRSRRGKIQHMDHRGNPRMYHLKAVYEHNGQIVYRAKTGHLYSLPQP